jgi:hypothetical protein
MTQCFQDNAKKDHSSGAILQIAKHINTNNIEKPNDHIIQYLKMNPVSKNKKK